MHQKHPPANVARARPSAALPERTGVGSRCELSGTISGQKRKYGAASGPPSELTVGFSLEPIERQVRTIALRAALKAGVRAAQILVRGKSTK